MSMHTEEQQLNRARLAAILPRAGLRKKHQRRITKMLRRYGVSRDTADAGSLRFGDSCIAAAPMPPWRGHTAPLSPKCE